MPKRGLDIQSRFGRMIFSFLAMRNSMKSFAESREHSPWLNTALQSAKAKLCIPYTYQRTNKCSWKPKSLSSPHRIVVVIHTHQLQRKINGCPDLIRDVARCISSFILTDINEDNGNLRQRKAGAFPPPRGYVEQDLAILSPREWA